MFSVAPVMTGFAAQQKNYRLVNSPVTAAPPTSPGVESSTWRFPTPE
jgi:hypothetical protein